jgi:hypothetical protein
MDYSSYNNFLSSESKGKTYRSARQKFIKLFFETTEEILTKKYGF